MAQLSQRPMAYCDPTSVVHTTQQIPLGTVGIDPSTGYEYMYVDFQQAFVAGEWVVYDEAYLATNLTATAVGPVGLVEGTVSTSDQFGWVLIKGASTAAVGTSDVDDNGLLQSAATTAAGYVTAHDPASDAGNLVYNAFARGAGSSATSFAVGDGTTLGSKFTVQITYPYVLGTAHSLSTGRST